MHQAKGLVAVVKILTIDLNYVFLSFDPIFVKKNIFLSFFDFENMKCVLYQPFSRLYQKLVNTPKSISPSKYLSFSYYTFSFSVSPRFEFQSRIQYKVQL